MVLIKPEYWLLYRTPILNTTSALLFSNVFAAIYVGSLYYIQNARVSLKPNEERKIEGTRDDPKIIRARLAAVSFATLLSCMGVFAIIFVQVGACLSKVDIAFDATLLRLGIPLSFTPPLDRQIVLPHLITPILFAGSLYGSFLREELPTQRRWYWRGHIVERFFSIQGVRNYWLCPLTEELVFRSCVLSVWHMAGIGRMKMIFLAPLTFGLAHVHKGLETYHHGGRTQKALKRALGQSLFQLAYTTVFGSLVSFLFLRTGSILPSLTSHIFCNVMGFPEINSDLQRFPHRHKVILFIYAGSIAGFMYTLGKWTVTEPNMYWPQGDGLFGVIRY